MKDYAIGIDVGGTTCKMGLFRTDGTLVYKTEIPTRTADGGKAILPDLAAEVDQILGDHKLTKDQVCGVGIGVPGPVTDDGIVNRCVNLGWGVTPLEKDFSAMLGLPVQAGNDADVAALGEAWMGSGKNFSSSVTVTLGTGVGGGLVFGGHILYGADGAAGEIGHMVVNPKETAQCNCGLHGCLEQYASATGVVRLAKMRLEKGGDSSMRKVDPLTAKDIFDCAKAGDSMALEVVDEMANYLGRALAAIACVVNPDAFILGGGVSKNGPILTETVRKYFTKYAFHACKKTEILLASLSNDAGIYGGAKLAIDG